ncbi:uncharacterized protein [Dysidea avara]|uniref:uncharacterized protein isoform X2 n=1 Tax=Dysidea avara TaxID=196820 RepID=UPI0033345730
MNSVWLFPGKDNHISYCDLLMEEFVFDESFPAGVSVEKLQDVEALSNTCVYSCVLPGLRKRVKDPTCSDRLAVLLGTLSSFSLEWLVSLYLSSALSSDVIKDHVIKHSCRRSTVGYVVSYRCTTPPTCVDHMKNVTRSTYKSLSDICTNGLH